VSDYDLNGILKICECVKSKTTTEIITEVIAPANSANEDAADTYCPTGTAYKRRN
jgi:hypothetical protein